MHSKITRLVVGATVALSLFGAAGLAQASSLSQTQINAIVGLLQSFGADQSTINQVNSVLGGTSAPAPTSCVDISRNLTLGSTGSDVTSLQNYLIQKGYLSGTAATGYYGYLTASAVGKLQLDQNIVSSQSDPSYGIMGPRTRNAVGCGGSGAVYPQPGQKGGLSAAPSSGTAPMTVNFSVALFGAGRGNVSNSISYGDGTTGTLTPTCSGESEDGCTYISSHTYQNPGSYTASARTTLWCLTTDTSGNCIFQNPNQTLGSVPVVVTGQASGAPSATIDQSSLTTTSSYPTITGSANTGYVYVIMTGQGQGGKSNGAIAVNNGQWQVTLSPLATTGGFPNGTYQVTVYAVNSDLTLSSQILTTGTLTVNAGQTVSADGSTLKPGTAGSLKTTDGTWTFGTQTQAAGNQILLNGSSAANGWGTSLLVTNGGHLYTLNSFGMWWMWQNGGWQAASNPTGAASATIDQQGAVFTTVNPTISGTFSGSGPLTVDVYQNIAAGGGTFNVVPVTNGHWSVVLAPATFPNNGGLYTAQGTLANGPYIVALYNAATTVPGSELTTGAFTVNVNAVQAGLTSSQMSSILSLLQSFGASVGTIADARTIFNGQAVTAPAPASITPQQKQSILNLLQSFGAGQGIISAFTNSMPVLTQTGTLQMYADQETAPYSTQYDMTQSGALAMCQQSANDNATNFKVHCTWNGTQIFSNQTSSLNACPQNAVAQRGQNGKIFSCTCPANFSLDTIWSGRDPSTGFVYHTDDSNICTAGVQAGQINTTSGGEVDYTIAPGLSSYAGYSLNGVTSKTWGAWPGSFFIMGPKACLAAGTTISMSDGSHKKIEDIKVGDGVESLGGGRMTTAVVTNIIQREDPILTINGTLKVAPDEVVYLANGITETADHLKIGDQLLSEHGRAATIVTITSSSELAKTYDLSLKNGNDFFADGYLVQALNPSSR